MRQLRKRLERGEGSLVELVGMVVILVALLDIAVFIVVARPAQVAAAGASRACARMAVDTLSEGLAYHQGVAAGQEYLSAAGIQGEVHVAASGYWNRWTGVTCTVNVNAPAGAIGLMRRIIGSDHVEITQSTTLTVGAFQARWGY
jgi:hypothetical protein